MRAILKKNAASTNNYRSCSGGGRGILKTRSSLIVCFKELRLRFAKFFLEDEYFKWFEK